MFSEFEKVVKDQVMCLNSQIRKKLINFFISFEVNKKDQPVFSWMPLKLLINESLNEVLM